MLFVIRLKTDIRLVIYSALIAVPLQLHKSYIGPTISNPNIPLFVRYTTQIKNYIILMNGSAWLPTRNYPLGGWVLPVFFSQRGARRRALHSIILVDSEWRYFVVSPQLRFRYCLFWYQTVILPYALVGNFTISENFTHNFTRERENIFIHKDNTCNSLFKNNNFWTLCTILII